MQLFVLFIDGSTLHVSGVIRPSSVAQEREPRLHTQFLNSWWWANDARNVQSATINKEHKKLHLVG